MAKQLKGQNGRQGQFSLKDLPAHVNDKKMMQSMILAKLYSDDGATLSEIIDSLLRQASNGNLKAMTFLRDTIGEKPVPNNETTAHEIAVKFIGSGGGDGLAD